MFTCYSGAHQTVCSQLFYTVLFEFVSVVFSVLHTEMRPRVPVNITMIWNHCYIRFQPETDDGNSRSLVHIKNSEMKEHSGGLHESLYWHRKVTEKQSMKKLTSFSFIYLYVSTKPGLDCCRLLPLTVEVTGTQTDIRAAVTWICTLYIYIFHIGVAFTSLKRKQEDLKRCNTKNSDPEIIAQKFMWKPEDE